MITEISAKRIYELLVPFITRLDHEKAVDAVHELAEKEVIAEWQLTGIIEYWAKDHEKRSKERQRNGTKAGDIR